MYTIIDKNNTYIDDTVVIGEGCVIHPNVMLVGNTVIGENTTIYMGSYIENAIIGSFNKIYTSYIIDSKIGNRNTIGPYANIRAGNVMADHNRIGSFVEMKNNSIKNEVKIPHLSYIGDAIIDDEVNIGAGAIIANSDGKRKNQTFIKEGVFIGSNAVLVAPLLLHKKSFVAAGSVITKDVPENNLAIARGRQENKPR
jgi:bifunctional UDP-N-acetylglucosamine pyrophosphorylase/glucosamine-1-phosphate N-acetyltransferase